MNKNKIKEIQRLQESTDYKDRVNAEYQTLVENVAGLEAMLSSWEKGKLDFEPKTPRAVFETQLSIMKAYLGILEVRAREEDIKFTLKGE